LIGLVVLVLLPVYLFLSVRRSGRVGAHWEAGMIVIGTERWQPEYQRSHGWLFLK